MAKLSNAVINQLSRMICGDDFDFLPYRSSSKLTDFFQEIGFDYTHDGSTRRYWVRDVLNELNSDSTANLPSPEIIEVIKHLLNQLHFLDFQYPGKSQSLAIEQVNRIISTQGLVVEKRSNGNIAVCSKNGDFISTSVDLKEDTRVITFNPSVFMLPQKSTVKNCVSVMMPFSKEFNDVYSAIKNACSKNGMSCNRADDFWNNSVIIQDIFELIFRSSIVIVDFSGKNENVFYEAGIAHTLGKNVIPITQSIDNMPFDLRHHRHIVYLNNGEGLKDLENKLAQRLDFLKE